MSLDTTVADFGGWVEDTPEPFDFISYNHSQSEIDRFFNGSQIYYHKYPGALPEPLIYGGSGPATLGRGATNPWIGPLFLLAYFISSHWDDLGSIFSNGPDFGNRNDPQKPGSPKKLSNNYLKSKGIDAHNVKYDILQTDKNMSKWNLYSDTKTGEIWMGTKDNAWIRVANSIDDLQVMYK